MRSGWSLTVGLVLAACAGTLLSAQGRDIGGIGITVFEDANYRGENATFMEDVPSLSRFRLDNRISSLRVAPGEYWEACEDANYRGRCQVFSNTESNLGRSGWNDRISSLRRVRGGGGGGGGGNVPRDGVVLYDQRDFRGDRRVIMGAVANLGSMGFNDRAESLELGGSDWEVCRDINFRNCELVRRSTSSLSSLGMSRRISSLRPASGGGWGGSGGSWNTGAAGRLELFDNRNFSGKSSALTSPSPRLGSMSGRADSIRLSGRWEICDEPDFRGRCRIVTESISDLNRIGWRNRVQSARPR
jgi:hypothetical protein